LDENLMTDLSELAEQVEMLQAAVHAWNDTLDKLIHVINELVQAHSKLGSDIGADMGHLTWLMCRLARHTGTLTEEELRAFLKQRFPEHPEIWSPLR
jgi:hypothetical protein